jgi:ubiquinone/menaquinone biosynthesis C-methylase UbiE
MSEGKSQPQPVVNSNLEWQAWGEKDPLFGVIPKRGGERGGPAAWTDEEFYESGRVEWQAFRARWERYGLDRDSCVEIGCGAGRLTRHLAQDFRTVHATDVAQGMIEYARRHVGGNVQLTVTDGVTLPVPDRSVTAVLSYIVFLHFDRIEVAAGYFAEMARVLKPGGTVMIQLPIHSWPVNLKPVVRSAFRALFALYAKLRQLNGRYHRFLLARRKWSPFMQSTSYDLAWLRETLQGLGFVDVEVVSFQDRRDEPPRFWILARKSLVS